MFCPTERIHERIQKLWLRLLLALVTLGLCAVWLARPAHAAEFRGEETVTIGADEVIDDDLFVAGETVTVDGTVRGDLFANGTEVTINGTVEGSLFTSGRTLLVNGTVGGSLYSGGYSLRLGPEATVARNVFFGGFSLASAEGSEIGRSIYSGGYQVILDGAVANDVNVGAGALEIDGTVGGNVLGSVGQAAEEPPTMMMPSFEGQVPAVPPGLRIGEGAQVAGDVIVEMETIEESQPAPLYSPANSRTRAVIGELIALLLIGGLLLWWRPDWLRRTGAVVQESPLPSLGIGLLTVIAVAFLVPVAVMIVVLLAIVGGLISFGELVAPLLGVGLTGLFFAVAIFAFVVGMVSKIIVAFWGGRRLMQRTPEDGISGVDFAALALGLVIYAVLRIVPFGIGLLIAWVIALLGVGAIFLARRRGLASDSVPIQTDAV